MKMVNVEVDTEVINPVYKKYLDDYTPTQIFYGGSSSGKSVFVIGQRVIFDILQGGRNYLICRQVGRTIRNSVFNEVKKTITDWGVSSLFVVNKADMVITCSNGYQILFAGLDDVEKLKSITPVKGVITDIVLEEATETELASLKQLEKRLRGGSEKIDKRLTLLFNPILQNHWIYKTYFESIGWADTQKEYHKDGLSILKTTYKDNKFLTKQDVIRLENEKDEYYYKVYTLGNWGVLGNVIFKNWKVEDLTDKLKDFTNPRNGLDFGFSSDPAASVRTHYDTKHKTIYIYDELYETGLTNQELAPQLFTMHGKDLITGDSSEPKSIEELNRNKCYVRGAKKGKDSVNFGIQWLQQQTIIVDSKCINMQNELSMYKWKEDAGGNAMPVPVDKNNHLIDALRYAYEDDMEQNWQMVGRY